MKRSTNHTSITVQPADLALKAIRCAIYTRKSTEEGLQQEFNSLDAQREAAEAFIASQRHQGWQVLADHYDDGGYTGGNMDRPAVMRLLADIEKGKVDCVVVYKVDRLSRSLLDFTKLMELFDRHNVSFVSVTQQFNTTNSLGRLTLHILLSFAQFERELISERTRDKMSAARKKGKWTGGIPVLGYDVDPRGGRLLVNSEEARRIRTIFELYQDRESLLAVIQELDRRGWTNKHWRTRDGIVRGGESFTKGSLHRLLNNVIYTGRVNHKGTIYDGEHEPIIEQQTWAAVQKILRGSSRSKVPVTRNKYGALLRGLLFCVPCGTAMTHSYTAKGSKRYCYYVCMNAQNHGWQHCPTKSISAPFIESAVVESIAKMGRNPELVREVARQGKQHIVRKEQELRREQLMTQKHLHTLHADIGRLAASGTPESSDRILGLQNEIEAAERRLTELGAELSAPGGWLEEDELIGTLQSFEPVWKSLTSREQIRLVNVVVQKIGYDGRNHKLTVSFRSTAMKELCDPDNQNRLLMQ